MRDVELGRFRQDLFYRLNVFPLRIPPLRQRREDIASIANFFLRRYAAEYGKPVAGFSPTAIQRLCSYHFPGNIRELENIVQQTILEASFSVIDANSLPIGDEAIAEPMPIIRAEPGSSPLPDSVSIDIAAEPYDINLPYNEARKNAIKSFERAYISTHLARNNGNVNRTAETAKLQRTSLRRIIARHQLATGPNGQGGRPGRPRKEISSGPGTDPGSRSPGPPPRR